MSKNGKAPLKTGKTPEEREKQLENLAVNLAEKQLREGTASPSIIAHFLKLASTREAVEREVLESQAQLVKAKADSLQSAKRSEQLAQDAVDAMKSYTASNDDEH